MVGLNKMLNIKIHTIPHMTHRYNTCGDYWVDISEKTFHIRVSDMKNWKYEFLVAIHEMIEQALTLDRGIKEEAITKFDIDHPELIEPGNSPEAPYNKEHLFATHVEKQLADELGVDWKEYEKTIDTL